MAELPLQALKSFRPDMLQGRVKNVCMSSINSASAKNIARICELTVIANDFFECAIFALVGRIEVDPALAVLTAARPSESNREVSRYLDCFPYYFDFENVSCVEWSSIMVRVILDQCDENLKWSDAMWLKIREPGTLCRIALDFAHVVRL